MEIRTVYCLMRDCDFFFAATSLAEAKGRVHQHMRDEHGVVCAFMEGVAEPAITEITQR